MNAEFFWSYTITTIGILAAWPASILASRFWRWCHYWDRWVGKTDNGPVVMWIKHLVHIERWQFRIDLHKFVCSDDQGCYHTHPALAIRIPVWGGYWEEVLTWWRYTDAGGVVWSSNKICWWPGRIGIVRPQLCHRISSLPNKVSYSLWIRFRVTHDIKLVGWGWPSDLRSTTSPLEEENGHH